MNSKQYIKNLSADPKIAAGSEMHLHMHVAADRARRITQKSTANTIPQNGSAHFSAS